VLIAAEARLQEATLVRAAQAGDGVAFGTLYERYERTIHGVLLAYVCYHDAEDLMQDVFVKALEQLSSLREPIAFCGWLISIARRTAIDHQRARKSSVHRPYLPTTSKPPSIEAFAILEVIQRLPDSYRETLILRLVEGMTGPEIAERTGLTADSVRVNLCRGMKLLRASLGKRARV
jgi:RNA polymerase sigma-70 factor, ECF subfamily